MVFALIISSDYLCGLYIFIFFCNLAFGLGVFEYFQYLIYSPNSVIIYH